MNHKIAKGHVRNFMRAHYADERLAQLLAHMQDGKFSFFSCCCFIGVATSDHALRGYQGHDGRPTAGHYIKAIGIGSMAEEALISLAEAALMAAKGCGWADYLQGEFDAAVRRILIPMVRAEMRRRDRKAIAERAAAVPAQEIAAALISQHMVAK